MPGEGAHPVQARACILVYLLPRMSTDSSPSSSPTRRFPNDVDEHLPPYRPYEPRKPRTDSEDDLLPERQTDDRKTVQDSAADTFDSEIGSVNVDSMLLRMSAVGISRLSSRWLLTSKQRGSKIVDKDLLLRKMLQVDAFPAPFCSN